MSGAVLLYSQQSCKRLTLKLRMKKRARISRGRAAQAWQPADKSQRGACHRCTYAQQVAVRQLRALTRAGAPDPAHLGGCQGKAATPTPNGYNLHPNGDNLHMAAARRRSGLQLSGRPRPQAGPPPSRGGRAWRPAAGAWGAAAGAARSRSARRPQLPLTQAAGRSRGGPAPPPAPRLTPPRSPARPPGRPGRPRSSGPPRGPGTRASRRTRPARTAWRPPRPPCRRRPRRSPARAPAARSRRAGSRRPAPRRRPVRVGLTGHAPTRRRRAGTGRTPPASELAARKRPPLHARRAARPASGALPQQPCGTLALTLTL